MGCVTAAAVKELPAGYARPARRAVVTAELSRLQGPAEGTLEVPRRLFWSGDENCGSVDLQDSAAVAGVYEAIIDAARTEDDLAAFLNRDLLVRAWPVLGMNLAKRRAWESRNPELTGSQLGQAAAA
jgi:hypothetical protein